MLAAKTLFSVLLTLFLMQQVRAAEDRVTMLERTNTMTVRVVEFAKQKKMKFGKTRIEGRAHTQLMIELEQFFSREKNPAVLARVALVTRMFANYGFESREDDDEKLEVILGEVWFACLANIKKLGGSEALIALDDMKQNISHRPLDGAEGLAFDKAREEVEQGIKAKTSKAKTPSKLPSVAK